MISTIYRALKALKSNTSDETNGRHIIAEQAALACGNNPNPKILDVGAGYGSDLLRAAFLLKKTGAVPELSAIESFPQAVSELKKLGVPVAEIDIEHDTFPFNDDHFDVVICNQVLEHTKEIFWVISELCRVVSLRGTLILGVPNLGSLHNRLALLAGYQPPAINVFGPHVRGFTVEGLKHFLETEKILRVKKVIGGNFYPAPPRISRPLSRMFPSLSVSSFYIVERISRKSFLSVLDSEKAAVLVDTQYFRGR